MAETKQSYAAKHGDFCWMELGSTDVEAAKKFYSELLGWNLKTSDAVPGFEYTEFGSSEKPLGGMYQFTSECKSETGEPMNHIGCLTLPLTTWTKSQAAFSISGVKSAFRRWIFLMSGVFA